MRTFKIYSLNNFQVCNTATMLYITSSGLIYWKFVLFNHLYPFCPPLTPCFWQPPMISVSRLLLLSHFSRVRLCATHRWQPTRLRRPWDSPGKNTGVGCHFLLQGVKVKSLSRVWLFAIPWTEAHQAPPSMGFSRQEYWSGVPSPSPLYLGVHFKNYYYSIIWKKERSVKGSAPHHDVTSIQIWTGGKNSESCCDVIWRALNLQNP